VASQEGRPQAAQGRHEFPGNQFGVADGLRGQKIEGPQAVLFGEQAHGERGEKNADQ
jgi:hypothetical protein